MTLDAFFSGRDESRCIFKALRVAIEALGPVDLRVTRSQVAFRRRKAFAWACVPDRCLHGGHAGSEIDDQVRGRLQKAWGAAA